MGIKKECLDCKYYDKGQCSHPNSMYCNHSELWTPKWNDCKHYDGELNCCKIFSSWTDAMPILQPCIDGPCEDYSIER